MGGARKLIGTAIAAALLASSTAPAMARPWGNHGGWNGARHGGGWGGNWRGNRGNRGYGGYGYRYGHRNDDFGDFLLGAVIIGGIAAVASGALNNKSKDRYPSSADNGGGYGRGTSSDEDRAAELCSNAAERESSANGKEERVEQISDVARDGQGWRVEGRLEDVSRYQDGRPFVCGVRSGKVDYVRLGERAAYN